MLYVVMIIRIIKILGLIICNWEGNDASFKLSVNSDDGQSDQVCDWLYRDKCDESHLRSTYF